MDRLVGAVLRHPARIAAAWAILLAIAAALAIRLPAAVQGSSGSIEDSESGRVTERIQQKFGKGSAYVFPVVVESAQVPVDDVRFVTEVESIVRTLAAVAGVRTVDHYWNTGDAKKAVAEYEKSLAIDPQHTATMMNMGIVKLNGLNDTKGAIAIWEKLLRENPQFPDRQKVLDLIAQAKASGK